MSAQNSHERHASMASKQHSETSIEKQKPKKAKIENNIHFSNVPSLVSSSPSSTDLSVCGLRMANAQHDALDHIVFVQSKIHTRRERVFADYSIDFVKTAVAAATDETSQVHFGREENVKLDNKSSAHMFHTERRMRRRRRISMF